MVARLTVPRPAAWAWTGLGVVAFAIAMGYVEAAVVVYLRAALDLPAGALPGGALPAVDVDAFRAFAGVEVARELATLVMITVVGWLAGRSAFERLAWAAVAFGTWDIVYYAGLWFTIGWPPSPGTWDVLFLIPTAWVGPVWAPVVVSGALIGVGLAAARRLRAGGRVLVGAARAFAAAGGGGLVILSFLVDSNRVAAGDVSPWTGGPLFWAGMALALVAGLTSLTGASRPPTLGGNHPQNEPEGRPPADTTGQQHNPVRGGLDNG